MNYSPLTAGKDYPANSIGAAMPREENLGELHGQTYETLMRIEAFVDTIRQRVMPTGEAAGKSAPSHQMPLMEQAYTIRSAAQRIESALQQLAVYL